MLGPMRLLLIVLAAVVMAQGGLGQCYSLPAPDEGEERIFAQNACAGVSNNPPNPTVFTIDEPSTITKIGTYHWNDASGETPGTIGLQDEYGYIYGPWQAVGDFGMGGVPNAFWIVYLSPALNLPAGTYTIIDSDPATWSYTYESDNCGIASVIGFGAGSSAQPSWDLTGVWDCNDGGTYYIRQSEDTIWWFGEPTYEPGGWSNDAKGTIILDTIEMEWSDVPKGSAQNEGTLVLQIESNDRLTALQQTGGFGGTIWTRRGSSQNQPNNPQGQTTTSADGKWTMGTGDVQVTLSWNANVDIDLHVKDPSGAEVYYNNPTVSSGGQLDLDNKCSNFVMGKPENIYWPTGKAPAGTYIVSVNYYADCTSSATPTGPVDWTVTTKVNGKTNTFTGTLNNEGDTQEVTTFQF